MMDEADQEKQEAARQRLREIMSGAPKIEDYITRVWEGLSAEQRTAVEARLDEYRERESKKREEAYVKQRVGERQKGADEARAEAARKSAPTDDMMSDKMTDRSDTEPPRRPAAASAERRERLLRIFERMSPEQQETLLERLDNLARERPAAAAENRRGPARKSDVSKPPPAMDEVDVPRQDEVEKPAPRNPD